MRYYFMGKKKLTGQKLTLQEKEMLVLFGVIVAVLAVILLGILAFSVPAVPVCVIVLLEAGLAVCLHDVPVWVHALVVLIQIVAGALCGTVVFMIFCGAIYLVGIFALRYKRDEL
jgi:hypothetical protein